MANKSGKYLRAVILLVAVLVALSFLIKPYLSVDSHKRDNSAIVEDTGNFLYGYDFNDGHDYILLIREGDTTTIIAQNSVLEKYKNKIRVGGFNWWTFVPGERGRPDKSIQLFRDGKQVNSGSSHTEKTLEFADIVKHGITVKYHSYYENRKDIEARIANLESPDSPRIFLLKKPGQYKISEVFLKSDLPVFWVSSSKQMAEIKADLDALVKEIYTDDIPAKSMDIFVKQLHSVAVQDSKGVALTDQNGDIITLDDVVSFYSPRLKISCENMEDCEAQKARAFTLFKALKSWRDNDLINSIERPGLPPRDENGQRVLHLDIGIKDIFWVDVSENKYLLEYYEVVE